MEKKKFVQYLQIIHKYSSLIRSHYEIEEGLSHKTVDKLMCNILKIGIKNSQCLKDKRSETLKHVARVKYLKEGKSNEQQHKNSLTQYITQLIKNSKTSKEQIMINIIQILEQQQSIIERSLIKEEDKNNGCLSKKKEQYEAQYEKFEENLNQEENLQKPEVILEKWQQPEIQPEQKPFTWDPKIIPQSQINKYASNLSTKQDKLFKIFLQINASRILSNPAYKKRIQTIYAQRSFMRTEYETQDLALYQFFSQYTEIQHPRGFQAQLFQKQSQYRHLFIQKRSLQFQYTYQLDIQDQNADQFTRIEHKKMLSDLKAMIIKCSDQMKFMEKLERQHQKSLQQWKKNGMNGMRPI